LCELALAVRWGRRDCSAKSSPSRHWQAKSLKRQLKNALDEIAGSNGFPRVFGKTNQPQRVLLAPVSMLL